MFFKNSYYVFWVMGVFYIDCVEKVKFSGWDWGWKGVVERFMRRSWEKEEWWDELDGKKSKIREE